MLDTVAYWIFWVFVILNIVSFVWNLSSKVPFYKGLQVVFVTSILGGIAWWIKFPLW